MYPTDRRYSKEHEWIMVDGNIATIGITDYAQDQLGDIVYVELPDEGKKFARDDVLGTIESVKAVSEIYSPLTGTVVGVNSALDEKPEAVNETPHGDGWYCKIEMADPQEVEQLMDAEAYTTFVDSQ